ncbi:MAG: hypothetical protein PUC33_01035 [Oscillospiraceae bacterium]|nr:hypothetical protein [Oscillospiraceae bacterium]
MKKIISIALILALAITVASLVACGNEQMREDLTTISEELTTAFGGMEGTSGGILGDESTSSSVADTTDLSGENTTGNGGVLNGETTTR